MVTAAQVWDAFDAIPDPEIPVISLVDLGVVTDVALDGKQVRIAFTPTFMCCPALDAMRRQMEEADDFAYVVVNDDVERAVEELDGIVTKELASVGRLSAT